MSGFIVKQPNGLYARHSHIVDCPTHWNMTEEEYLNNATGNVKSREEGKMILERHVYPFQMMIDKFVPNNMTKEDFDKLVKEMTKALT